MHKKSRSIIILGAVLVVFAVYNMFQIVSFNGMLEVEATKKLEAEVAPKIGIVLVTANSCEECIDIRGVMDVLKATGANITTNKEVDFDSTESGAIIDKYGIKKIPTAIIIGEVNKSRQLLSALREIGYETQGHFVYNQHMPPYIDTETGEIKGKVSATFISKSNCEDCVDLTPVLDQLELSGMNFISRDEIDVDSREGRQVVNKYDIRKVPVIVFDKEFGVYDEFIQNWDAIGTVEDDGSYVMRANNNPHYSLELGRVMGVVDLIILNDLSCTTCYDGAAFHKGVLQRMGVYVGNDTQYDVRSDKGRELIDKYEITKLPTAILNGDMKEYPALVRAWETVGTVEPDGNYVFRRSEVAGQPYKDLATGEVVTPSVPG